MRYLFLLLFCIALTVLIVYACTRNKKKRYDSRGFNHNRIHKNGTKYDDSGYDYFGFDREGYRLNGYNIVGRNRKGQYDRYYDSTSGDEEGFVDPRIALLSISAHASMRIRERMGIQDAAKIYRTVENAYRFGKSKRQIKKTSIYLVEQIERKYANRIVLIYHNYIFIFSHDNQLITVYPNETIPL